MVHPSSAFHPYTRPIPTTSGHDLPVDDSLRLLLSAEALIALAQLQDASKILPSYEPVKDFSPQLLPAMTPTPIIATPSIPEQPQPLQSPSAPNEKSRRKRTTFSPEQATRLEAEYIGDSYMAREKRHLLAQSLKLSENQVKTWFQNRRAKDKRDRKSENASNHTSNSRRSSPSRKSSSDSTPTPTQATQFDMPTQIQTASPPTTADSAIFPPTSPESIIQKIEQFPSNQILPNFDILQTYLQSLSSSQIPLQFVPSTPPLFDPNMLVNFQSPLQSAII
ncbi:Homeobox protein ceh-62 [Caenorhabditis elegans]|uniref:Homeobox protein ceh-62 n=1 Tax=Caenorhabditis elegans TaxID=6239 RepID=UPI00077FE5FA|nr:Homeobox protein ceh-62 [Caenorhabditis elegans]CAA86776.2 Homeobox protein ceh-62 [Caenorhabditis elegans]|eukprot:NP_496326.2 Homeobox protein ceh-62 [Caenorhabditis elegans]